MNYLILLLIIIISTEILIIFNYSSLINSVIRLTRKAIKIISNKHISDHWKEKIIPEYALRMMRKSLSMLLIFLIVIVLFFITSTFLYEFLEFIFSYKGIIASTIFACGYFYLKKLIKK